jgi:hypothetical protein
MIHLFSMSRIESKLSSQGVDSKGEAEYLLVSMVIFSIAGYAGLIVSSAPPWSLPTLLEGLVVVGINALGVVKAYESAGGKSSVNFVAEFTCLYVPASITTLLTIWTIYWGISFGATELVQQLYTSNAQIFRNIINLWRDLFGFLAFLANVLTWSIIYWRIIKSFERLHNLRGGTKPPIETSNSH